ncbi:sulfatase [bacterium]|nr:sulfatase [candidate division CSSED10-310 bacterium]
MSNRIVKWLLLLIFLMIPLWILHGLLKGLQHGFEKLKPDVLLITIDTCRMDAIGGYGNPRVYTPVIDNLIRHGVQFVRGYAPVPTTAPSHATMLTGREPGEHGVFRNGMKYRERYPLLSKILADFGYRTAAFVSGYSLVARVSGLDAGFAVFDDQWSETRVERDCEDTVASFTGWVETIDERPFFAWIHLFDPHSPYQPPSIYAKMILDAVDVMESDMAYTQQTVQAYRQNIENAIKNKDFGIVVKDPTTTVTDQDTFRKYQSRYLGEICRTDRCLNNVFEALRNQKRMDRTLILLTSDHGEGFDHTYFFGHGDRLWESAVSVPWILRYPMDKHAGFLSRTVAFHHDLMPTVMNLTQSMAYLPDLPGENLDFQVRTALPRSRADFIALAPSLPRVHLSQGLLLAAYDPRFKLIRNETTGDAALYDLAIDPAELHDCREDYPRIVGRLGEHLDRYRSMTSIPEIDEMPYGDGEDREKLRQLGYID